MNVDIWSDIACPWCFIGKRRFEKALAAFPERARVTVNWHSYQLDPGLPEHFDGTELDYLAARKGMPRERVRDMFAQVAAVAAGEGLEYDFDSLVVANSLRAHELLHLAKERGLADAVKDALLSAHFERGKDIGSVDLLERVGVEAGLEAAEVRTALSSGEYAGAVQADIQQARALGIQGVPFFVIDNRYGVSGAQPTELFSQALAQAWAEKHPLAMVPSAAEDEAVCGPDGCVI